MPSHHSGRVLIVDDENDLTEALAIRLSSGWGFTVAVAHDAEEGLRKASVFRPEVILLDIAMPRIDGWEMCSRLRDDPNTRDIPVVVMTAWATDDLEKLAAAECVAKVLLKPAEDQELLDALKATCGASRPREALVGGWARAERKPAPHRRSHPRRRH